MASATRIDPLAYLGDQIAEWKKGGTYQRLRILEGPSAAESRFDGRDVINLASNNYLGLTTHPKLIEAAIAAGADRTSAEIFADCYTALVEGALTMRQAHGRNDAARVVKPAVQQLIDTYLLKRTCEMREPILV